MHNNVNTKTSQHKDATMNEQQDKKAAETRSRSRCRITEMISDAEVELERLQDELDQIDFDEAELGCKRMVTNMHINVLSDTLERLKSVEPTESEYDKLMGCGNSEENK